MDNHSPAPQEVRLSGELDIATSARLRSLLGECDPGRPLLVDLHGVTFMDSSALGELIATHRRHEAHGSRVVLAGAAPSVRRVLRITGLDTFILQAPTTAAAWQLVEDARPPTSDGGESDAAAVRT